MSDNDFERKCHEEELLREQDMIRAFYNSNPQMPSDRLERGLKELYDRYVKNWEGEGEPVCYNEFIDNEYDDMASMPKKERIEAYPYSENSLAFDYKWQAEYLIDRIKEKGAEYGLKFVMNEDFLNERQADFFYDKGEQITLMKSDFGTIVLECQGELRGELLDNNEKLISDDIYDMRNNHLRTDHAFYSELIPTRLNLCDNNWFELAFYDKDNKYLCEFDLLDIVGGTITGSLEELYKIMCDTDFFEDVINAMKKGE